MNRMRLWSARIFFGSLIISSLAADASFQLSDQHTRIGKPRIYTPPAFVIAPLTRLPEKASYDDAQPDQQVHEGEYTTRVRRRQKKGYVGQAIGETISGAVKDIFVLHKNLFTWSSFKVVTTAFPFFVAARMIDEKLQNCFYDKSCHKNINQMPSWCHDVAKVSIAAPIVLLGLDGLLSRDNDRRWTAQILLVGMPFVIWTKKLVKQMEFQDCLRPWNEKFSCKERSFGGFPSGHMAQALYMAVLYGMRYGPRYAVPLSAMATFIGVTFITCNRHYLSQILAGSAFGTIYALAASKLVDMKLTKNVKLGLAVDHEGRPKFSVGVSF